MSSINISTYIGTFFASPLAKYINDNPWDITTNASAIVQELMGMLANPDEYRIENNIAVHKSAEIEVGATLKGPLIIGPSCFIANSAYLRGGNWLESNCILGPGVELKSSFIFSDTKLAHFNFVGDSIIGSSVNLEAGSIIANYRNERENKDISVWHKDNLLNTHVSKFGALVGDDCRIGANAVIAPGSLMASGEKLARLALLDQDKN
jgi:NDP-sugar pyrophosphorylase family protein